MSVSIKPTVGRVVWFYPASNSTFPHTKGEPLSAQIAKVWSDTCVNLGFLDADGVAHNATSVLLVQDGDERPQGHYCEWMPYQKGQAAKTEEMEKKLTHPDPMRGPLEAHRARRELSGHRVDGAAVNTRIFVMDDPGSGGACHDYLIQMNDQRQNPRPVCAIHFQNGPIKESGVNGIGHEDLLEIVIDRLKSFQAGPYACTENGEALLFCKNALSRLHQRTIARMARNVEGTHQK